VSQQLPAHLTAKNSSNVIIVCTDCPFDEILARKEECAEQD
jgi:hypothetical protein